MNELFESFYSQTDEILQKQLQLPQLKQLQLISNQSIDHLLEREISNSRCKTVCGQGCSYCCYLKVELHAGEVFLIADYIKSHFSESEIEAVKQKAKKNWELIEPMSKDQHFSANLACPLLDENSACSVYEVRPSTCRRFHSQNLDTCRDSYEKPDDLSLPNSGIPSVKIACATAYIATSAAFKAHGYDVFPYDLNPSLLEALNNPSREKRWRKKKNAFPKTMRAKE